MSKRPSPLLPIPEANFDHLEVAEGGGDAKEVHYAFVLGQSLLPGGKVPPTLQSRVDTAVALYCTSTKKSSFTMFVSGADVAMTGVSEAAVMKSLLLKEQVPEQVIFTDEQARNTVENAMMCFTALKQQVAPMNPTTPIRVGLITSSFHMSRALYVFRCVQQHLNFTQDFTLMPIEAADCLPLFVSGEHADDFTKQHYNDINELPTYLRLQHEIKLLSGSPSSQDRMLQASGVSPLEDIKGDAIAHLQEKLFIAKELIAKRK